MAPITKVKSDTEKFAELVYSEIPSLKLKSASPTRAGRSVQVRVTWITDGKTCLGYYSLPVNSMGETGKNAIPPQYFLRDIMRLETRASMNGAVNYSWDHELAMMGGYRHDHLVSICQKAYDMMRAVAGKASKRRSKHLIDKAREVIRTNVTWATTQGLEEAEIIKIVRDAYKIAVITGVQES